ncbi:hypothetical protein ABT300_06435 [Streptomyces sp. NPDC001027]|uniref:hypothetical protein n=1 Tax=Streptomyces sp. NPDC001027 TaxID=3154771 RepID=UPI0033307A58
MADSAAEGAPLRRAGLTRPEFDLLGALRRRDHELTPAAHRRRPDLATARPARADRRTARATAAGDARAESSRPPGRDG